MKKPAPPQDLWAQLDAITGPPLTNDPGITTAEYGERHGITASGARYVLEGLVREGKLLTGWRRTTGKPIKVYRPA